MEDEIFMKEAIKQAKRAYKQDEVPIGCVIVQDGKVIARAYNKRFMWQSDDGELLRGLVVDPTIEKDLEDAQKKYEEKPTGTC